VVGIREGSVELHDDLHDLGGLEVGVVQRVGVVAGR
jgi:hypothetical protein